ncbi:hypothetical protein [Glycomyces albidus]|uniref:Uncharacterized protein n=1 Tax=Glycomyces albidus TaxID=2656774 RepID=A0A6L5G9F8_9ACTN|nr:hypothetical protein [Glycomyces albidus]MQM26295.1 hypothetical protein [Glycomyces albidus]
MDSLVYTVAAVGRVLIRGAVEAAKKIAQEVAAGIERDKRPYYGAGYAAAFAEDRRTADKSGYGFREEWKERLVYSEPGGSYTFECGWGDFSRPYHVYVPAAESWDRSMPEFMRGRRDEILERLRHWAGGDYIVHEE